MLPVSQKKNTFYCPTETLRNKIPHRYFFAKIWKNPREIISSQAPSFQQFRSRLNFINFPPFWVWRICCQLNEQKELQFSFLPIALKRVAVSLVFLIPTTSIIILPSISFLHPVDHLFSWQFSNPIVRGLVKNECPGFLRNILRI